MKRIRHDADGRTWLRVPRIHRRRADGSYYIRYHWTCLD